MHQRAGLVVVQHGADRHLQNHILALFAAAVGALAVASALRLMFGIEAEVNQGVVPLARLHDDIAAASAISAGGTAAGNKFLPPEGHAAVAAVPCLHTNSSLIDEHSALSSVASLILSLPPTDGCPSDCLRASVSLMSFMRLSVEKAAQAAMADDSYRKPGHLDFEMWDTTNLDAFPKALPSRMERWRSSDKSFGWPIQAVLWLEWATMPPPLV